MVNSTDPAMTDAANPVPLVERIDTTGEYLITKGGTYYRPNAEGYTRNRDEAGRYTLEEAILHSHPNGPDGPRDGIRYELAPPTAALSAIPVPVEVQGLIDRLTTKRQVYPPRGSGNVSANGEGSTVIYDDGMRLVNPDGPKAATALAQQAATIAALTAERDGALDALREIAVNEIARAAIVKEMKG